MDSQPSNSAGPQNQVLLQSEDEAPPSYSEEETSVYQPLVSREEHTSENSPAVKHCSKPPSYQHSTNLPTYEDVEKIKEDELRQQYLEIFFGTDSDSEEIFIDGHCVGDDCLFWTSFFLAFFLNWIGFFVGYCLFMKLASRYGAVSGFGLSLVNWLLYLKLTHQSYDGSLHVDYVSGERVVLWWAFMGLACALVLRGLLNWYKIRRVLFMTPEERENGRLVVLY